MNDIQTNENVMENDAAKAMSLRENVKSSLEQYFEKIGDAIGKNVYEMVLAEIEAPLLEVVMRYTRGNQSKAAILLGLSRGTLRKKLKEYGFIE